MEKGIARRRCLLAHLGRCGGGSSCVGLGGLTGPGDCGGTAVAEGRDVRLGLRRFAVGSLWLPGLVS